MCHEPSSPKESNNLKAFARLHKQKFKDMMFENEIKVQTERLNDPKPSWRGLQHFQGGDNS